MSDQVNFTAEDWFDAPASLLAKWPAGRVAICIFDPPEPRDAAHTRLVGTQVTVDGTRYIVRGVEGFAVTRPQNRLGLLVEPATPPLPTEREET